MDDDFSAQTLSVYMLQFLSQCEITSRTRKDIINVACRQQTSFIHFSDSLTHSLIVDCRSRFIFIIAETSQKKGKKSKKKTFAFKFFALCIFAKLHNWSFFFYYCCCCCRCCPTHMFTSLVWHFHDTEIKEIKAFFILMNLWHAICPSTLLTDSITTDF